MKTAQKELVGINLLPQEEFAASTLGRVFAWLLSTFRIIVIITEVVVMGVFFSRFWLDAKSNDLNELIRKNQSILETTIEFENEFKSLQKKLDIFSKLSKSKIKPSENITTISKNLPIDVYLTSIQITDQSIQVKGNSANETAVSQFLMNLKNKSDFSDVILTGTNTDQQNISVIEFNIKINF